MSSVVNVNDLLDGHVGLDLECLDRVYLNGYVPGLQVGGQVVRFMKEHLGLPIPSPAMFNKIGTAFRRAVSDFAAANDIPVVRFKKGDRRIDLMRPYLDKATAPAVVAIGVAQEFQWVFTGYERPTTNPAAVCYGFEKAERRVTCFYFYVVDPEFGPGFVKICSYFPYPVKVWVNGHEWAKRQAVKAGIGFSRVGQRVRRLRRPCHPAGDL